MVGTNLSLGLSSPHKPGYMMFLLLLQQAMRQPVAVFAYKQVNFLRYYVLELQILIFTFTIHHPIYQLLIASSKI
jgi:hypothetical protein